MDAKQIIDRQLDKLATEKEEIRTRFLAELETLGDKAKTAAQHEAGALPPVGWVETSMAGLGELRVAFEQAERARAVLRRVADAAEFEASRQASA
jgi:hypothetical protein